MLFYKILFHLKAIIKKMFLKLIYGKKIKFGKHVSFRRRFNVFIDKKGLVNIGNNVFFNNDCSINAMDKITIGDNTIFGPNVMIFDHDHDYKKDMNKFITKEVTIGNNVWIGANCVILKGVTIGNNVVVATGTTVRKNIESNSFIYQEKNIIVKKV